MSRTKNFSRIGVLEKAIPVFWRLGFAETYLQDLERTTSVNKSGLYSEFKDKEDLYLECMRHYRSINEGIRALATEPLGWANIERFLVGRQKCLGDVQGCLTINSMRELAVLPRAARDIVLEDFRYVKRLVAKNIKAGGTTYSSDHVADLVMTFFAGLCMERNLREAGISISRRKTNDFLRAVKSL